MRRIAPRTDRNNLRSKNEIIHLSDLSSVATRRRRMDLLDDVQVKLRDPRHSDHGSRGTEVELPAEHDYVADCLYFQDQVLGAFVWLESEEAAEELRKYAGPCLLISSDGVVGHGSNWEEAYKEAADKGVSPRETVEFKAEERLATL